MTGIWKKHKHTLKLAVISIIFNYIFGGLSNISHWHGVMTCLAFRGFDFGQTVKRIAFDSHQYKHHCQRGQIFAHSPGMFRLKNTMTLFGLYYFFFRRWEVNIRWLDAPAIKLRSSRFAAESRVTPGPWAAEPLVSNPSARQHKQIGEIQLGWGCVLLVLSVNMI